MVVQPARRALDIGLVHRPQEGLREHAQRVVGVAAGRLVRVLPETIGWSGVVAVVYPDRERLDPKVRAFVDFVAKRAADLIPPTVQRGLGATAESA